MSESLFIRPTQIGGTVPVSTPKTGTSGSGTNGVDFQDVFRKELETQEQVKFSAHALKRLESRKINLSQADLNLLNDAVNRAEAKGSRESLVLMDELALIVSIKNRTVITAVDGQNIKENVFTNIDSAVIAK